MPDFLPHKSGPRVPCTHHDHTSEYSIFSSYSFLSSGLHGSPAHWSGAHTGIKFYCSVPLPQLGDFCFSKPCVTSLPFLAPWEEQNGPRQPSLIFRHMQGWIWEDCYLVRDQDERKNLLSLIFGFLYSRLLKNIWRFIFPPLCPGVPGRVKVYPFSLALISFFFSSIISVYLAG